MSARQSEASYSDDALKYPRGVGPRISSSRRPLRPLEWLALGHAAILLIWTTWAFGGGAEWMRPYFAWWGTAGILITSAALCDPETRRYAGIRPFAWSAPVIAFNAFVLVGCLNPNLREVRDGAEIFLVKNSASPWLPSSARPQLALPALWLFDALWLTAFNLALVIRRKHALRWLLLLAVVNALALAVFGTVQKFARATGIYFGEVETRQIHFFASFVYHNHWGAFMLLMLAATIGLTWHFVRRAGARDFFHSPAFTGTVALFFMAATVPLSGSRSCTLFAGLLFAVALAHWLIRVIRQRRRLNESAAVPVLSVFLAIAIGVAGVWWVARDSITIRSALTRSQVETMLDRGSIGARSDLYGNTWRMAKDNLWFGWGMNSYPHVFTIYNTQKSPDRLPVFYRDAHSDWLQAFAEHGLVGSALLALCAVMPLWRLRPRHFSGPLRAYLLLGCGLVLLYAWIEFPFANVSVVLTWWICFFAAVRYAQLVDRNNSGSAKPWGTAPKSA